MVINTGMKLKPESYASVNKTSFMRLSMFAGRKPYIESNMGVSYNGIIISL